jgi:hypothetical protein
MAEAGDNASKRQAKKSKGYRKHIRRSKAANRHLALSSGDRASRKGAPGAV